MELKQLIKKKTFKKISNLRIIGLNLGQKFNLQIKSSFFFNSSPSYPIGLCIFYLKFELFEINLKFQEKLKKTR